MALPDDLDAHLAALTRDLDPRRGLYGPGSVAWRVYRERALVVGGARALLLQLAHPAVAQGVADHSRFRDDAMGRARRTFDIMHALTFGARDEALAAAASLRRRHGPVRGTVAHTGARYDAADPALLLWVAATLQDTALRCYEALVGPLGDDGREALYAELRRWFVVYGLDPRDTPESHRAFRAYVDGMLHGAALTVTPVCRMVADALVATDPSAFFAGVLDLGHPRLVRVLDRPPLRGMTHHALLGTAAAMLPAHLRQGFGLPWGLAERAAWRALVRGLRASLPALPPRARYLPQYLAALARNGLPTP